jgi:hemoglobin-like flavoprotein
MLVYLLILGLAAPAMAGECCSAEDRKEIRAVWQAVWGAQYAGQRVRIAQAVFNDLFEHHPETKVLFKNVNVDDVNSPQFKAHCIRVINGLDGAINLLADPATLNEQLKHLGAQHKAREGVKATHFTAIAESFSRVLPKAASCFNPGAWDRCFKRIADAISHDLP